MPRAVAYTLIQSACTCVMRLRSGKYCTYCHIFLFCRRLLISEEQKVLDADIFSKNVPQLGQNSFHSVPMQSKTQKHIHCNIRIFYMTLLLSKIRIIFLLDLVDDLYVQTNYCMY